MALTVPFTLITPDRTVFDGPAELVIAVTTEGEEGILPRHAPLVAALRPGVLRANVVRDGVPTRLELATSAGFLQALPERVVVIVEQALGFEEIDVAQARAELAEAQERQRTLAGDPAALAREQAAADFALAKLRITGHR